MYASREFEPHQDSQGLHEQETLPHCLVLVGSRNGFDRDIHLLKVLVSQVL